ncbi:PREDICTED: uncharacterized protein LOC105561479 [Vollenhovia emeryi]|uniref:uncharacterized protein LOC105561479 n=1 Tax=Vollenhovia emeryi TaxID=411798 RepID=UPI0005F3BB09|nr:PREDICTED: uncharacterized protein LOC105561479 [Vollenhovia emeryi]XP_011866877.1 PREDICTED: uncharacterized protein LOC105561479 [Vollenhovia emeryi]
MILVLLVPIIGFVAANPLSSTLNDRLDPQVQKALSLSTENRLDAPDDGPGKLNETVENTNDTLSTPKYTVHHLAASGSETRGNETNEKRVQGRKHKAIFVNYPLIPPILHYPRVPTYEVDYNDNNPELAMEDRSSGASKRYQESDIFYIRLPPIPYMFVPGLGYISQPPTYPGASLKPQIPLVPQLVQLHQQLHVRPVRPQPVSQQTVNPFIKLPIDFISNGKPTSVYQWQKKPGKKPTDSPITNLDNLSADFVNNGKPTSIYQWQANLKPVRRPEDSLNSLDMGPYTFNGKLTSMYLLGSDDSTSMHQPIRHSNYQNAHD